MGVISRLGFFFLGDGWSVEEVVEDADEAEAEKAEVEEEAAAASNSRCRSRCFFRHFLPFK